MMVSYLFHSTMSKKEFVAPTDTGNTPRMQAFKDAGYNADGIEYIWQGELALTSPKHDAEVR